MQSLHTSTSHLLTFAPLSSHFCLCNFAPWHLCPNSESAGGPNGTPYRIVGLGSDCFRKAVERTEGSFGKVLSQGCMLRQGTDPSSSRLPQTKFGMNVHA